jgi:hypothetical protein
MNPMKISLNHDKFTDRSFDLPMLNPTPKEGGSSELDINSTTNTN